MEEHRTSDLRVTGSNPVRRFYGVWHSGSASVLGIEGHMFESCYSEICMLYFFNGEVTEWLKVIDCKSIELILYTGSNPVLPNI